MKTEMLTESQSTGNTMKTVKKSTTITAPAYIDGDISLNSNHSVTINGP